MSIPTPFWKSPLVVVTGSVRHVSISVSVPLVSSTPSTSKQRHMQYYMSKCVTRSMQSLTLPGPTSSCLFFQRNSNPVKSTDPLCRVNMKHMKPMNRMNHVKHVNRQQCRCWYEEARNPELVKKEEKERKKSETEEKDVVGKRIREIQALPGDTQTIWVSLFLDSKLVDGTQITIPKHGTNIDMIKYAVKERCSEILTDIAAITFQVLPTRHKRKKSKRKLTRKNRILKPEVLYDMAQHGGESEDAGIIVKAHTRRMQEGSHFAYGEISALDLGVDYLRAIMQDYQEVPGNSGMKVLYDVPDLECATLKHVVLREGITESLWNQVIEISESSSQRRQSSPTDGNDTSAIEQQSTGISSQANDYHFDSDSDENESDDGDAGMMEESRHRYRVCVVGSSGVGKTTTTCILIRMLLERGKSVVYHIRTTDKSRWVYEFIPNRKDVSHNPYGIEVKVTPESKFQVALTPTLVDDIKSYYIVDPGTTVDSSCIPDDQVRCRVVLIASPNERLWGGRNFTMLRGGKSSGTFLYYPTWNISELLSSYPLMIPSTNKETMTRDVIKNRYYEVGGIPGHLLAPSYSYRDILDTQLDNISSLTEQQLKLIHRNCWRHLGSFNTVAGFERIPDNASFNEAIAAPVSMKAFESICSIHSAFLWNQLQLNVVDGELANRMFIVLCRNMMVGEALHTMIYRDASNEDASYIHLGGCLRIEMSETDVMSAATGTENVVFCATATSSSSLVDFAYRKGNVYYVFACSLKTYCELDLNRIQETTSLNVRSTDSQIHYYYVVPSFHFERLTVAIKPNDVANDRNKFSKIGILGFHIDDHTATTGSR